MRHHKRLTLNTPPFCDDQVRCGEVKWREWQRHRDVALGDCWPGNTSEGGSCASGPQLTAKNWNHGMWICGWGWWAAILYSFCKIGTFVVLKSMAKILPSRPFSAAFQFEITSLMQLCLLSCLNSMQIPTPSLLEAFLDHFRAQTFPPLLDSIAMNVCPPIWQWIFMSFIL